MPLHPAPPIWSKSLKNTYLKEIFGKVTGCALQNLLKTYPITGIFWPQVRKDYTEEQFFAQNLFL